MYPQAWFQKNIIGGNLPPMMLRFFIHLIAHRCHEANHSSGIHQNEKRNLDFLNEQSSYGPSYPARHQREEIAIIG